MRNLQNKRGGRRARPLLRLHPLFCVMGIWYAISGELFLFLLSTLVALQHECAHAFAAAKLGYRLNAVVLMPFGAVIDGDLSHLSLKDEITVALYGPLCNLATALFFAALWWFAPTTYAFTDVACFASLSIALVNFLPAYPLDGGRILRCLLARAFAKSALAEGKAERRAEKLCRALTLLFALFFLVAFALQCKKGTPNFTMLAFACFLTVGGVGNRRRNAVYEKINLSCPRSLRKGVEIRRVAIDVDCPIKDAFRFLSKDSYLVLEVYEGEAHLFNLSQNELSALFVACKTPYEPLRSLQKRGNFA